MKIQLIHPPHPDALEDRLDVPLGLLYLASSIQHAGHEVVLSDLTGGTRDEDWRREIIDDADIYGITTYFATQDIATRIAQIAKDKNPNGKVIGGGASLTCFVEQGITEFVPKEYDSVVVGDGELSILELMDDFPNLNPTYQTPIGKDLDKLPRPNYGLVDLGTYKRTINGRKSLTMLTSRGCPFRCTFCGLPRQHRKINYRSPEDVADEMEDIQEKYGISAFNIQDDTFLVNKKRIKRWAELVRDQDIIFKCHGKTGLDTEEDYAMLAEVGLVQLAWGIETGSPTLLEKMNKGHGVTVESGIDVIRWAQKYGIDDRVFLIVGFPGETRETIEETKRYIERANPTQVIINTFQPYPDTDVWKHPEKYGVTKIYDDFSAYEQVKGENKGGRVNIDTLWTSREEMEELDAEFREWMNNRDPKLARQEYETDQTTKSEEIKGSRIIKAKNLP